MESPFFASKLVPLGQSSTWGRTTISVTRRLPQGIDLSAGQGPCNAAVHPPRRELLGSAVQGIDALQDGAMIVASQALSYHVDGAIDCPPFFRRQQITVRGKRGLRRRNDPFPIDP